jgi:hypothetical protein
VSVCVFYVFLCFYAYLCVIVNPNMIPLCSHVLCSCNLAVFSANNPHIFQRQPLPPREEAGEMHVTGHSNVVQQQNQQLFEIQRPVAGFARIAYEQADVATSASSRSAKRRRSRRDARDRTIQCGAATKSAASTLTAAATATGSRILMHIPPSLAATHQYAVACAKLAAKYISAPFLSGICSSGISRSSRRQSNVNSKVTRSRS